MMEQMKHTPGPWSVAKQSYGWDHFAAIVSEGGLVATCHIAALSRSHEQTAADARLIAAAPDHAAIGWAMCVGSARWEPWGDGRGEFCMNGLRYATKLDEFGIPEMTDAMRAAIARATGAT